MACRRPGAAHRPADGRRSAAPGSLAGTSKRIPAGAAIVRSPGPTAAVGWRWSPRWKTCVSGTDAGDLVEHAHEVLDRLPGPDRGDLLALLLQVVGRRLIVLVEHALGDVDAGVRREQLLLLGGTFRLGSLEGVTKLAPQLGGEFGQLLLERLFEIAGYLRLEVLLELLRPRPRRPPPWRGRRRWRARPGAAMAVASASDRAPARRRRAGGNSPTAGSGRSDGRGTGRSRRSGPGTSSRRS